jgi:hypothetical protein
LKKSELDVEFNAIILARVNEVMLQRQYYTQEWQEIAGPYTLTA